MCYAVHHVEGTRLPRSCPSSGLRPLTSPFPSLANATSSPQLVSEPYTTMTRSKQIKRASESQPPPSDDSDCYIDEGLAESKRKIARKQPKWLDKMTAEAKTDRLAFSERVAEILAQRWVWPNL